MRTPYRPHTSRHGIIWFLFLIALAMVELTSFAVFLPLFFLAVAIYALPPFAQAAAYLGVARTVCKNE